MKDTPFSTAILLLAQSFISPVVMGLTWVAMIMLSIMGRRIEKHKPSTAELYWLAQMADDAQGPRADQTRRRASYQYWACKNR